MTAPALSREALLRRGLNLERLTVAWNALEAIVAIGAGYAAGSVALVGFGLDSVIESISGVALYRRLWSCGTAALSARRCENVARFYSWD